MKDIDHAEIQVGLVFRIDFDKVQKSGSYKPSFQGGSYMTNPPSRTDRVKDFVL